MGEIKIRVEIVNQIVDEKLDHIMECVKKIQQENNLRLSLVEISVKDTTY